MMQAQRERLHELLMGGIGRESAAYHELDELVAEDLKAIEPVIDEMVAEAAKRNLQKAG